jgi:hypothetical protein
MKRKEKEKEKERRSVLGEGGRSGVAGDPALYVVTLVNSPFFPKTCEVNEKKRKRQTDGCTWSPL